MEDADSYMTGPEAVKLLADVVSMGGNLLLTSAPTPQDASTNCSVSASRAWPTGWT